MLSAKREKGAGRGELVGDGDRGKRKFARGRKGEPGERGRGYGSGGDKVLVLKRGRWKYCSRQEVKRSNYFMSCCRLL